VGRDFGGFLAGVRALDLSAVGPASRATRLLADYGAEVVKIEPVDERGVRPPFFAYSANRFMRRACIDLGSQAGRDAFLALAAHSDVVVESFRPGVADRLGIGYPAVKQANPAIIYCSTSGYGQNGSRSGWAGHDIDYLACGGFLASSGRDADGAPVLPGATVADAAGGGMHAALAIAAALFARNATGEGCYLDVSATAGVLSIMSLAIDEALSLGSDPGPSHDVLTGRYACYGIYRCCDGRYLAVGAIEEKFFANLCRALGIPEMASYQYDDEAQPKLREALAAALATKSRDEWVSLLAGADTCVAPVLSVSEVAADEELPVLRVEHPVRGGFRQMAPLLAGMVRPEEPVELRSPESTDTKELLAAAGYCDVEIGRFLVEEVIR